MAIYQENNILFTNVIKPSFTTSGRIAKGKYTLDGSNNIITKPGPVINAIDIDWNGAQLDNNLIINSSSDLLYRLILITILKQR
ncbi:MAG: hypothetical protein IKN15_13390 [Bacteroidaceae bacterium]|jgi:hypothetical protein|nr:hypothetical protein [Bacteroidaceae bacterium]